MEEFLLVWDGVLGAHVCTFIQSCVGLTGVSLLGCDETFSEVNFGEGVM